VKIKTTEGKQLMANQINFHQLTPDFYAEHSHLVEMLDKDRRSGTVMDKGRGYGVLLVQIEGHQFAIPLRSTMHINHRDGFTTKIHSPEGVRVRHGLDYSKAVIIYESRFVSADPFFLHDRSDYVKIVNAEHRIIPAFEKYVQRYINAVKGQDRNVLRRYRYSTLQNYHNELGCE
jgi:protein AbiQ